MSVDPYPEFAQEQAALDATLLALADLTTSANTAPYFSDVDQAALMTVSPYSRTLFDDLDAAAWRATLGVPATGTVQPLDATLTALAGLATGANQLPYSTGTDTFLQTTLSAYSRTLLDDADAPTWRATLLLGTMSTQNANAVAITGGSITAITDLAIADGGTAASTAAQARTNLGLGTISTVNSPVPIASGGTAAADAATARTNLGLGSMAVQNSNAVTITAGTVSGLASAAAITFTGATGFGYAPAAGQFIRAGGSHFDYLGAGYAHSTSYSIRAGNSYFDAAGFGYGGGSGYAIRATTAAIDSMYAVTYASIAGGIDTRWNLRNYGSSYQDGTAQFANVCGFGYAPNGSYWIRAGSTYVDSLTVAGATSLSTLSVSSTATFAYTLQAAYIGIGIGPNYEGYPFHVNSEAKFRASIRVDGTGYKPGGGSWADSSSRHLKRHIAPIVGALALLLGQRGRVYEWEEPLHARVLPGPRYGFVADEVTIPQWCFTSPEGEPALAAQGFEALCIEALREIVHRLEALERG